MFRVSEFRPFLRHIAVLTALALVSFGVVSGDGDRAPEANHDLTGKVVRVLDGDTIEILDAGTESHRIRLHGIDTPERGQPFSRAASSALVNRIAGKQVDVAVINTDRYRRTVGVIYFEGQNINLSPV